MKCYPHDYVITHTQLATRYPAYLLPNPRDFIGHDFPPFTGVVPIERPMIHPFVDENSTHPPSIQDILDVYQKHMYVSLATVQMAREMSTVKLQDNATQSLSRTPILDTTEAVSDADTILAHRLSTLKTLYILLLPTLPATIGMLIRLLYYVNIGSIPPIPMDPEFVKHREVITKAVTAILLILTKMAKSAHVCAGEYVSLLMVDCNSKVLMLKMLSVCFAAEKEEDEKDKEKEKDAVKSENHDKVDKKEEIGLSMWCNKRKELGLNILDMCSTNYTIQTRSTPEPNDATATKEGSPVIDSETDTETEMEAYTDTETDQPVVLIKSNWRNFFSSINLLRLLQIMTKNKPHRILNLVQWKSSAVLKRVLKVNHLGLQFYALKLLKSQVPYLGKKWRAGNMRIVTSIFLNLRPELRGGWLAGDLDVDVDEALVSFFCVVSLLVSSIYKLTTNNRLKNKLSAPSSGPTTVGSTRHKSTTTMTTKWSHQAHIMQKVPI